MAAVTAEREAKETLVDTAKAAVAAAEEAEDRQREQRRQWQDIILARDVAASLSVCASLAGAVINIDGSPAVVQLGDGNPSPIHDPRAYEPDLHSCRSRLSTTQTYTTGPRTCRLTGSAVARSPYFSSSLLRTPSTTRPLPS